MSTAQLTIIPFNSKRDTFRIWKIKVVSYLKSAKLYSVLINESIINDQSTALNESTVKSVNVKSSNESTADQSIKSESELSASQTSMDERVKCFLIMCLDDELLSVLHNISDESTTAIDIWNQLIQRFERQSTMSKYYLKSKLMNMRMQSGDSVNDFINRIIDISQQLSAVNCKPDDVDLLYCLLNGISVNENLRSVAQMLPLMDNITFVKACDAVMDTELQMKKSTPMTHSSLI
jgi:gag-polypeptide of LTR copia-type